MIFELEGIGFKFGLYASAITEKEAGVSIGKVIEGMARGEILPILHYFYGAAIAYNESKGKPKVTILDISDQIEKIGLEKAMNVLTESLQMPKNSEAPKETGQN
jgi:hypothetical protein